MHKSTQTRVVARENNRQGAPNISNNRVSIKTEVRDTPCLLLKISLFLSVYFIALPSLLTSSIFTLATVIFFLHDAWVWFMRLHNISC